MLFIISSNQEKALDNTTNTGAQSLSQKTEEVKSIDAQDEEDMQEELDSLLDKISTDNTDDEAEVKDDTNDEEVSENSLSEKKRTGFFSLFKKHQAWDESTTENSGAEDGVSENEIQNDANLIKHTPSHKKADISPSIAKYVGSHSDLQEYPGTHLDSYVGKKYEVWVHSLKLNNVYFNETLAYMMKGDIVEQLTLENTRGCFQVKIIDSVNSYNNGKVGYVCKKYLADISSADEADEVVTEITVNSQDVNNEEEVMQEVTATVATVYYTPNQEMFLQDKTFTQNLTLMDETEVLKKIGDVDTNGCFEVKIVGTSEANCKNTGLTGYVCKDSVSLYTQQNIVE